MARVPGRDSKAPKKQRNCVPGSTGFGAAGGKTTTSVPPGAAGARGTQGTRSPCSENENELQALRGIAPSPASPRSSSKREALQV